MKRHFLSKVVGISLCATLLVPSTGALAQAGPEVEGQWGNLIDDPNNNWDLVAIHMVMLKTGKVLCVHHDAAIFDPTDPNPDAFTLIADPPGDPNTGAANQQQGIRGRLGTMEQSARPYD